MITKYKIRTKYNYNVRLVCACPKPVPRFPTLYVLVFIVVSDFEVIGGCWFC